MDPLHFCIAVLPLAVYAAWQGANLPAAPAVIVSIAGIVFVSSLVAFSSYQFGVRALGASTAGLFMYLMTPYGVIMAVLFLGEEWFSTLDPIHQLQLRANNQSETLHDDPRF